MVSCKRHSSRTQEPMSIFDTVVEGRDLTERNAALRSALLGKAKNLAEKHETLTNDSSVQIENEKL